MSTNTNTLFSQIRKTNKSSTRKKEANSENKQNCKMSNIIVNDFQDCIKSVKDEDYEKFTEMLTIDKFKEFLERCKVKEIENVKHDMKLKKSQFFNILDKTFPDSIKELNSLYEKIFKRFKIYKAELKPNHTRTDTYFLTGLISDDEIDIYEISCAFICFIKCYIFEKIKLLFDLTDIDDDGYINELEIKHLIYTLNNIFSSEDTTLISNSTLIHQSLARIKSLKALGFIMNYPGNLRTILDNERYINFKQFFTAIEKVYNYKYDIIPLFLTLRRSLNFGKSEHLNVIKGSIYADYCRIVGDVCGVVRVDDDDCGGGSIDKFKLTQQCSDIKKHLEVYRSDYCRFGRKGIGSGSGRGVIQQTNNNNTITTTTTTNTKAKIITKKEYKINYAKICGLECYPFLVKFVGNIEEHKISPVPTTTNNNTNLNIQLPGIFKDVGSIIGKGLLKHYTPELKQKNTSYMTNKEILDEILILSNKHRISDEASEELRKVEEDIKFVALKLGSKLKGSKNDICSSKKNDD